MPARAASASDRCISPPAMAPAPAASRDLRVSARPVITAHYTAGPPGSRSGSMRMSFESSASPVAPAGALVSRVPDQRAYSNGDTALRNEHPRPTRRQRPYSNRSTALPKRGSLAPTPVTDQPCAPGGRRAGRSGRGPTPPRCPPRGSPALPAPREGPGPLHPRRDRLGGREGPGRSLPPADPARGLPLARGADREPRQPPGGRPPRWQRRRTLRPRSRSRAGCRPHIT